MRPPGGVRPYCTRWDSRIRRLTGRRCPISEHGLDETGRSPLRLPEEPLPAILHNGEAAATY